MVVLRDVFGAQLSTRGLAEAVGGHTSGLPSCRAAEKHTISPRSAEQQVLPPPPNVLANIPADDFRFLLSCFALLMELSGKVQAEGFPKGPG